MRSSGAARAIASLVTERDWQRQVTDAAELYGWRWLHVRKALKQSGHYMTPTSGPLGVGWVDLLLVRDRVLFVELKAEGSYPNPAQRAVHDALRDAGAEVHVWRPSDLPTVLDVLSRKEAA